MTTVQYVNLSLQISGCLISDVVMLYMFWGKHRNHFGDDLYLRMLLLNTGTMTFDAIALLLRGKMGTFFWVGIRAANFLSYTCNYLLLAVFLAYITNLIGKDTKVSQWPMKITHLISAVSIGMLIVNLFHPIFYVIDAQNLYHRISLFWLSQIPGVIGMVLGGLLAFSHRHDLRVQEQTALWCYILMPFLALIVQIFIYGIAVLNLANTIVLFIVFLFIQEEQERRMIEKENELIQSSISIMLSQIQPHFLYNSLTSIAYLCDKNPTLAKQATQNFAQYLRGNMDSLKQKTPVTFSKELEHVQLYLSLEKLRFESRLRIVYDIQTTAFMIPSLTVQPLVENAVKYGICKSIDGGTVTISTREYADHFEVVIQDNGVGFDPEQTQNDGRTHVGIDNVRSRLAAMLHAELKIQSIENVGTTATITLPKGGVRT